MSKRKKKKFFYGWEGMKLICKGLFSIDNSGNRYIWVIVY